MGVKFDIECAYNKYGVKVASLKKVLNFITIDSVINDTRVAAYLLATAGAESGYDLQKWESDSACKKGGNSVLYPPCQKAIDYFNTTLYINSRGESVKKLDYRTLGVDPLGIPYYGRGLIQLTGKGNFSHWGSVIGVDLVNHPELALVDENSYLIASKFIQTRCAKFVMAGDLYRARGAVNAGHRDLPRIQNSYEKWYNVLTSCGATPVANSGMILASNSSGTTSVDNTNTTTTIPTGDNNSAPPGLDLQAEYANINSFLLTGHAISESVSSVKTTEPKKETDETIVSISEPTHEKDTIIAGKE